MPEPRDTTDIDERLQVLTEFRQALASWGKVEHQETAELRSKINELLIAARNAVVEAGAYGTVTAAPPPMLGGVVARNLDPFDNLFTGIYGMSFVGAVLDQVDRAIGVYRVLLTGSKLTDPSPKEAIDIESAIERALRPHFRRGSPTSEEDVQDAVETILAAIGVSASRGRESVAVGGKGFIPDFVASDLDLAIEVKLAKTGHGVARIQEEITADIAAYGTRWRRLLVIVYDLGEIDDPYAFRRDNAKHFGASVVVVKH
jgi:hypothetical protein